MGLPEIDTTVGWSFGFEFDGIVIKQIQEVSGLKMENDVIELKQNTNDGKYVNKKLPGRPKAGEVTLTRGLTDDNSFQDWMKKSHFGDMAGARKGGAVIVYDFEGSAIKRYKLDELLAEEPGDRHAEGRRHQRADREADHHPRRLRARVMRRGAPTLDGPASGNGGGPRDELRTEFEFELPRGYVDRSGTVHRARRRCAWPRPGTSWCRCTTTGSGRTPPT